MVTDVSPRFMSESESFSTYFYDPQTRTAKRLYAKKFTPTLAWAYETISYDSIPQAEGAFFNWNTDEKWQRYPEAECNLSLR
jgi:hypothetical protein